MLVKMSNISNMLAKNTGNRKQISIKWLSQLTWRKAYVDKTIIRKKQKSNKLHIKRIRFITIFTFIRYQNQINTVVN